MSQVEEAMEEERELWDPRVQLVSGTSSRLRDWSCGLVNESRSKSGSRRSGDIPRTGDPLTGESAGDIPVIGDSSATSGWWGT